MKTVLLAEVSPRLKQGGLTIERLVQLNAVDVEGETFRGRCASRRRTCWRSRSACRTFR